MVNVSEKTSTTRHAKARALVVFPKGVWKKVEQGNGPKGGIFEPARIAGIQAAKRTWELIPLCHSLALEHVKIEFENAGPDRLAIFCETQTSAKTGVEMEALTGASVAALTVYDMCKALDKGIQIERIQLLEKSGGKSGKYFFKENSRVTT